MIVGERADDPRDFGAVAVAPELFGRAADEIASRDDPVREVRVGHVDARVDDRDPHAFASREAVGIGDVELPEAALQSDVGIVVRFRARFEHAHGLRQPYPRFGLERLEHRFLRGLLRDLEHRAVNLQQRDRPLRQLRQVIVAGE